MPRKPLQKIERIYNNKDDPIAVMVVVLQSIGPRSRPHQIQYSNF